MKGYLRTVEALIAVIMVLGSFQIFLNWSSSRAQSLETAKATIEDLMTTHAELIDSSYYDTGRLEKALEDALPSDLNHKLEAEYFTPIDILLPYREEGTPYEITVDFAEGVDPSSITVLDRSEIVPSQVFFNWYRIPFHLISGDDGLEEQTIAITVDLPYAILGGNVVKPDPASLDLYLNGTQKPFSIQTFNDSVSKSKAVLAFNVSLPPKSLVNGFVYFSGGSQIEKNVYSPNITYVPSRAAGTFTSGQGGVEKVDRAQMVLPLNGEFYKPKFLILNYKVQTPQLPLNVSSSLSNGETQDYSWIKNSVITVNISKLNGDYGFWVEGTKKFSAPGSGSVSPRLLDQNSPLKRTVTWDTMDGQKNITYFVSLFNESNEILIQRRMTAISTLSYIESDTYSVDSPYNKIYLINETVYDGPWVNKAFERALPWIVTYNSATNESLGFLFDKPDSIIPYLPTVGLPTLKSQTLRKLQPSEVVVENIHVLYTPPSGEKNRIALLYQLRDGLIRKTYSWESEIGDLSSEFRFSYVVPSITPTLGKIRINLQAADEEDIFGCTLNGNLLFNMPLLRRDSVEVLFPPSWLKNENTLRCYTDRGKVTARNIELLLGGVSTADRIFESLFWNFLPLDFTSNYTQDRNITVNLNQVLLGLDSFNESFVVLDANGYALPFSTTSTSLTFNTTVPGCCNKPSLHYLLFSSQASLQKQIIPMKGSRMENFYSLAAWGNDTWPENATVAANQKTVHVDVLRGRQDGYYRIWWNLGGVSVSETPYLTFKYRVNSVSGNGLFIAAESPVGMSAYVKIPTQNDGNWHIITLPMRSIAPSATSISKIYFAVAAAGSGDHMDYELDWVVLHDQFTNLAEDLRHDGGDSITLNSGGPIKLDLGIVGKVNKKYFYLPHDFNFKYDSSKVIAEGQDTVSVRRYVFDPVESRAAILKLTVWRRG